MLPNTRTFVLLSVLAVMLSAVGAVGRPAAAQPAQPPGHDRPSVTASQATAALNRAELLLHGTRRQARAVQRHGDATMVLRDLRIAYRSLSTTQRRQADRLLARPAATPTNGDPKYTGTEHKVCNTHLCVHYDLRSQDGTNGVAAADRNDNGVPDYVDGVLSTVTHVRSTYGNAGYRLPLNDSRSKHNGGDGRTDIYLAELGNQDLYGYCTSDDPALNNDDVYAGSAYCVLDNDYRAAEFPTHTPFQNLQVTAAHEFFHAVQFAYDFYADSWIMEATASWAEDELYTGINDNVQYLDDSPLSRPTVPIDIDAGDADLHKYGSWIFFRFLTEELVPAKDSHGTMPVLMRQIWQKLDSNTQVNPSAPGDYSIVGVRKALAAHEVSLTTAVTKFDIAARHPSKYFEEAAANDYPAAPLAGSASVGPGQLSVSAQAKLRHLSYEVIRLSPKSGMGSSWRLRLQFDLPAKSRGSAATLWTNLTSGATSSKTITLNSSGNATVSIPFGSATVKNIEVELINASGRFSDRACYPDPQPSTVYSCYAAHGLDDNGTQQVTATAYRN